MAKVGANLCYVLKYVSSKDKPDSQRTQVAKQRRDSMIQGFLHSAQESLHGGLGGRSATNRQGGEPGHVVAPGGHGLEEMVVACLAGVFQAQGPFLSLMQPQ